MADWQDSFRSDLGRFAACHFEASPEILSHGTLGWLANLVVAAQEAGRLPRPDEVTPRQIGPAALPNVLVLDVVGDPRRYRLRLVGTKMARMSGRDNTGRFFDELADHHGAINGYYLRLLDHIAEQRRAVLITADMFYRKQSWQHFRALWAPLATGPAQVDRIAIALEVPKPSKAIRQPY